MGNLISVISIYKAINNYPKPSLINRERLLPILELSISLKADCGSWIDLDNWYSGLSWSIIVNILLANVSIPVVPIKLNQIELSTLYSKCYCTSLYFVCVCVEEVKGLWFSL